MIDIQADVREFMAAFNQAMPDKPQWPDQETMDLRVRLEAEEFCERLRDSGYTFIMKINEPIFDGTILYRNIFFSAKDEREVRSLAKTADALIDQIYVIVGALLAMGIDMWPLWDAVQQANMAKAGGPVVNGKQMKPEGWKAPDIEGLLKEQGWEGEQG